jgi:hypothetical protein
LREDGQQHQGAPPASQIVSDRKDDRQRDDRALRLRASEEEVAKAQKAAETDLAAFARIERARLKEAGAPEEHKLREMAR